MFRICSKCKEEKNIEKFVKNKRCKDGYSYVCKKCRNIYNIEYNKKNAEKRRESVRKYYKKNKSKISNYLENYIKENKEKILKYQKEYRKNNKTKIKKYRDKYNKDNKKEKSYYNKIYGKSFAKFDSYFYKIEKYEEIRKDPDNEDYLQTKCANCDEWFNPTNYEVKNRIRAIKGTQVGELRLYCSDQCKELCSVYRQILYPKGFKNYDNIRDGQWQAEWAEMIKKRDGYECVKCGSTESLEAHHLEGINENCIEMWDLNLGVTFCYEHHKKAHSEVGCRFVDLIKENFFGYSGKN